MFYFMLRATLSNTPAAAIDTISEDPPADINGRVNPVSGRLPVAPPILIID
jgi:hypothetical protein